MYCLFSQLLPNCFSTANRVKVRLNNGTQKIGLVQAVDPVSDLATIKINGVGVVEG